MDKVLIDLTQRARGAGDGSLSIYSQGVSPFTPLFLGAEDMGQLLLQLTCYLTFMSQCKATSANLVTDHVVL